MTETALALRNEYMPALTLAQSAERYNALVEFVQTLMKRDTDYGIIPGTGTKPTLLKPGAEKLCTLFGLAPRFELMDKVEDWTGTEHGGEPLFAYRYLCSLLRGERLVGSGEGSCNSWEKKYRYRSGERLCPKCGKPAIIKGKAEYGGGWLCFAKKGGCGAKFKADDPAVTSQSIEQVKNPDVADVVNTLQKMAQKRALVAATLIAVNASEFFTQDVEDMSTIEGDWREAESAPAAPAKSEPSHNGSKFWARWNELVAEGKSLGLTVPEMDAAASDDDIVKAGKALGAAIKQAKDIRIAEGA